ncbi:MAG TPA: gliding motility-associated C-terminal domain-containing protein [Bacteroidia bacterium]|jgi:gliding motility-associated-like protein
MKSIAPLITIALLLTLNVETYCQNTSSGNWVAKNETQKSFIENKGQFKLASEPALERSAVKYAFDGGASMIYFTSNGLSYSFLKRWKKEKGSDEDPEERAREFAEEKEREQRERLNGKSHAEIEAEEHRMEFSTDIVNMTWVGANTNCQLVASEPTTDYHVYITKGTKGKEKDISNIPAFRKLTYKNLYPNIDVEYVFHPENGIKYALILHPGADISLVKMKYSSAVRLNTNGDIIIPTKFGDLVDHAPFTFYTNHSSSTIASKFVKKGKTVSFALEPYDKTKQITIDPWTVMPTGLTNSNSVWECERDGAGNVYIIGGDSPMKLLKYSSTGVLQWTYNTTWDTANYWLGTFAVDLAGNSYVTSGTQSKISKVSTAGANLWTNNNIGGNSQELWNISFNCDQTRLIIGGTAGLFTLRGAIFDLNVTNGNVITTKIVGYDTQLSPPPIAAVGPNEVRSICSAPNGKYYFLILDSVGRINQNFTGCSSNSSIFKTNSTYNFAYYNPSYRYDNAGIMAIRANKNFLYTQNGSTVSKRSLNNLSIITTAPIPGGINVASGFGTVGRIPGNSGLDVDTCGNVYVGSGNSVIKYDANLNQIGSVALPFTVFDVTVSTSGDVIVAGSTTQTSGPRTGYVQSISSFGACAPITIICCNATICSAGPVCASAAPLTLQAATPGGTWSGPGVNAATGVFSPSVAGAGTHSIIYTLPCGSDSISITVNPCTLAACQNPNGTITASGGTAPYNWQNSTTTVDCSACPGGNCFPPFCSGTTVSSWNTFATGTTITPSGTYPIRLIDNTGSILMINSLASLPACPTACPTLTVTPASQVNVNCFGQSTGSVSVSATGGSSPYDYTLMNGASTVATFSNVAGSQVFSNLPAGTYTLNVVDNNNCPGTLSITITQPANAVTVSITGSTNASCGTANGSATAAASGGSSPYDYVWTGAAGTLQTTNNVAGSNTLSGLAAGTYTVTITDNNNCTSTTTVTITSAAGTTVSISSQTHVLCFAGTTGSATAAASGGSSPYDYIWTGAAGTLQTTNNVAGSNTLSNLSAGTYTVTVTDNAGCIGTATATITQPASAASVSITGSVDPSCGAGNGSATATASGGTGPYDYVWTGTAGTLQTTNNISTANTLSNLAAGTYTVTITDNNSCSATAIATIVNTGGAAVSITGQTNVLCFGASSGDATAAASGGSSPYDYVWTGSSGTLQTTNNIAGANTLSGLAAGSYTVTVTDNAGCISTALAVITQPSNAANVSITSFTDATCGAVNGSATATAAGGSGPYDYVWTGSAGTLQTTNNIAGPNSLSGLAAGTYTVTVADNNNCIVTTTATISSTGGATVTISSQSNVPCFGGATGEATATAAAGSSPYDYVWTGAGGTLQITNNIAGPNSLTGLTAGTYTVSVTDNAGCVSSATAVISEPLNAAAVSITGTTSTPCGLSTGNATAQASGGSSPYDYVWTGSTGILQTTNNITTANTLNGVAAGTYTVTITDNNGCTSSATANVSSIGGATVTITNQTNVLCFGLPTGNATASAAGGVSPYDYVWTGSAGTLQTTNNITVPNTLSALPAGTYTVTVTDNSGCISNTSVTITQPANAAAVSVTGTTPAGCGSANGSATAQASGGTGPYDYVWSGPAGTIQTNNNISGPDVLNGLASGTYTITITDNNGCLSSATASVSNSGGATTTISSQVNVSCLGGTNGSATASTAGGTAPYDYVWTGSTGTLQTTNNITVPNTLTGIPAGTYTVTVTDNGNCISTASVTITQPSTGIALVVSSSVNTTCGLNNGSASISATGGSPGYSYNWLPAGGNAPSASALAPGTYTVTATDLGNCTSSVNVTIAPSTGVTASVSTTNVSCNGNSNGTATVTPSGGTGTYAYSWSPGGAAAATVNGLAQGTYTVTVTSGSCSNTATGIITQPPAIQLNVSTTPATCANPDGSASVSASGGNGVLSPVWSNSSATATISNIAAGSYTVTVTDANSCSQTAVAAVLSTGSITAAVSPDVTIMLGESTTLTASGGQTYLWGPAPGLSCTACAVTTAAPAESTTYCVTADSATCKDTACVRVNIEIPCPTNKDLAVPNAFSPNGDSRNDIFCLQGWSNCIQSFTIYIYDRWGEKVFESSDASFCWDGTYRGKALDPAVFVYFINATFTNSTKVDAKGNISLIR